MLALRRWNGKRRQPRSDGTLTNTAKGGTMPEWEPKPKFELKTLARFAGSDLKGGHAGLLLIEKRTLEGAMITRFVIGMAEDEIRQLRDACNEQLEED
jgi:hypothetical protein